MENGVDEIFRFAGEFIVYGGGTVGISYLLFQYLGKKWIENKFSERLEQLKHEQALELQKLRVEIDSLLSGTIRLQEKEFLILPEAWSKLYDAHTEIKYLVSPWETYLELTKMTEEEVEDVLRQTKFSDSQKTSVRVTKGKEKTDLYRELTFIYKVVEAKKSFQELQSYVTKNGIFLSFELKTKMTTISDLLWSSITSKQIGHEFDDWKMQNRGWNKVKEEVEPIYKDIENYIHNRLQSHGQKNENQ